MSVSKPASMQSPAQVAQHALKLAEDGHSMKAVLFFQHWITSLPQASPSDAAWFCYTPVLKACMWLKVKGGALGQAIVLRTESIPIDLRHLVLHGDSISSTAASFGLRSLFHVDSMDQVTSGSSGGGFRLGCHDYHRADKNEFSEIKAMGHRNHKLDHLSWHIEVRSDGTLMFRNTNPAWKELILRGPVHKLSVEREDVLLGAMPLHNDVVFRWEICLALSEACREDPDLVPNQFLIKCVGAETAATTDCFLRMAARDDRKRDFQSYYVFFEERHRLGRNALPSWRIQQSGIDAARAKAKLCTSRLLECTAYDPELMKEGTATLGSGFYDHSEHAELMVALSRVYTMGTITVNKLGKASELLSTAIKLHKFYLDTCLDPKAELDLEIPQALELKRQKINDTIKMLDLGDTDETDKIDTID